MCDRLWSPPTAHPCLMRSHAPCTMDFEHLHVLLSAKSRTRARESVACEMHQWKCACAPLSPVRLSRIWRQAGARRTHTDYGAMRAAVTWLPCVSSGSRSVIERTFSQSASVQL